MAQPNNVRDLLIAKIHEAFTVSADQLAMRGYLTQAQRIGLSGLIGGMLGTMNEQIDAAVSQIMVAPDDVNLIAVKTNEIVATMTDAIKSGARHSTRDQKLIQDIHDRALELGAMSPQSEPRAGIMPVKTIVDDGMAVYGGAIKTLKEEGDLLHVGGYLVIFSDENNTDDRGHFFTPETDFGNSTKSHTWFHHTLPIEYKTRDGKRKVRRITREFPETELSIDDIGVFAKSVLDQRNAYERMVAEMIKAGKMGYSSGTAPHLIKTTEMENGALRIDRWILGDDASYDHTPAEWKTQVVPLKTLDPFEIELPEAEPEASDGGDAASTEASTLAINPQDSAAATKTQAAHEENEMTPEEIQSLNDTIKASVAEGVAQAVHLSKEQTDAAIAALKTAPPTTPPAGLKTSPGNGQHQTPLGDDAFKAFGWYLKTGDPSGIRTGEAFEAMLRDRHTDALKTTYTLLESTQYQGQEAVPTEVVAKIVERRDPVSVVRRAGADVIQVGSNAFVLPVEKASPENFVITTIDGSNTFDQTTVQPMDKLAGTIYLFTKSVPIDMNLLDDSVFGIEQWWTRRMGRAWGLTENTYFLMGTGSSQPQGAVYSSTLGVTAASGTAVTAAEVVDLYHKVPAEYRDKIAWVMRGATEGAIRKLTVSTQFPFVGNGGANGGAGMSGLAQGQGWLVSPSSGVFNSDGMDALTTSKKPIFCGNLEAGYVIAERKGLTVFRDPYSLSTKGLVNILAHFRETGGVTNALALYHLLTPSA